MDNNSYLRVIRNNPFVNPFLQRTMKSEGWRFQFSPEFRIGYSRRKLEHRKGQEKILDKSIRLDYQECDQINKGTFWEHVCLLQNPKDPGLKS